MLMMCRTDRKKFYLDLLSSFNKTRVVQSAKFLYESDLVRDSFIVSGPLGGPPSGHFRPVDKGAD